jgi:hypothetical protein
MFSRAAILIDFNRANANGRARAFTLTLLGIELTVNYYDA